ncbi:hypothetical protein AMATHDRAFT_7854 [Amanita thiersii Skay4041]|uniref:DUF4939 domain-containing protein n=1 Tax=Amanita thiersii Skay4041 TaxID=703135 RepID=A0A2A9NDR9_9AGAR|nr:hypothetical protein AMATHDRAFT_7854 [Amanita thiersii Skay4041]
MMVSGPGGRTDEPDWTIEQVLAQIQQLLGAVNNLQQTIAQQGQTIAQLQAQATVTPLVQGNIAWGPKMATPPLYNGSMAMCEAFINACWLYISAKPHKFTSLQTKITWVLGFMQLGMVQLFCNQFMGYMITPAYRTQYLESNEPDPIELLYADIYKAFGDPNKQATAIQEITTIKQGTKTGKEHFKRSLNTPLLNKIMAVPELPITLEKWYNLAVHLDRKWRQAVMEKKTFAARSGKGDSSSSGQTRQTPNTQQLRPPTRPTAPLADLNIDASTVANLATLHAPAPSPANSGPG